jgi:two-component system phosphate regulon sensor histidine kinase PhoR
MFWRITGYLLIPLAAGAMGWLAGGLFGLVVGWLLASGVWLALDVVRSSRVLLWLRQPDAMDAPAVGGLWGELTGRLRRQLRSREQATAESDRRLSEFLAAIQASPNGVVLLDRQSRIEWCNQTAASHFGFDARRDVQQHLGNLVRDPVFMAYVAGGDFSQPVTVPGRSSTPSRPVRLSVQLHPYGEGRSLLLSNDVTALEQAEAMRRDFVANVSHEIRTPLTVLSGFIETLQTLPLEAADRERYLGLMAQQSQRMQGLVHDLLTLSRLEGSPPPGLTVWTPVATLLMQCDQEARALSALLDGSSRHLAFDAGPSCALAGAPSELLSALANLVNNAVRYTPPGGTIQVTWALLADGRGEFAVRDSGPGIEPEHIPRLTERFYRVDRSRSRETGGTGLGLAIVKHVVQRHGAELVIQSTPGQGSRFSVVFPESRIQVLQRERLVA